MQCADQRIGDITLVPESGTGGVVAVRVVMGIDRAANECVASNEYKGCIVGRRRLGYVPQTTLRVPIRVYLACKDVACDAESTCNKLGRCVPAALSSSACATPSGCAIEGESPDEPLAPRLDAGLADALVTPDGDASSGLDAASDAAAEAGGDAGFDAGATDAGNDAGGNDAGGSDAGGGDAGGSDSGAGGAFSIACGPQTCTAGFKCCWDAVAQAGQRCVPSNLQCFTDTTLACDSAEDCPAPQGCCYKDNGASCASGCSGIGAKFICTAAGNPSPGCPVTAPRCGNPVDIGIGRATCL